MTSGTSNMGRTSPPNQPTGPINSPASPPSKRDLKSWWKNFKLPVNRQDAHHENRRPGIFGVPLRQSITYANVAISLVDENGQSYIYGYVPIVVAKCGVFLKEKATSVEGIFRLSGSEKRIKELKTLFDSPDRYGKGLVWDGYTVHDAANVLRRYLNDLPEPVVPLDLYEKFRDPLRGATKQAVGDAEGPQFVENFNEKAAIEKYQKLITELPPLNKQLLLYILDLLAVFAAKSDENRMNSQNLAAIFQPGMLSHPAHAMAPEEYRLNQCVIIFLIENQDHFLIGMQGTAADETTMKEVSSGPTTKPQTPNSTRQSGLGRTASNASAGAESVRRDGKVRRNRSVSSRHSKADGSVTPNSPSLTSTPTGGLARSNTLPSKKSPALVGSKFKKHDSPGKAPHSPSLEPLTQAHVDEGTTTPTETPHATHTGSTHLSPHAALSPGRSQERLLDVPPETSTPTRDRNLQSNLQNIFQRSPHHESGDKRQPNKLKKKRIPGTMNLSAQSSNASLTHTQSNSPALEVANPMETIPTAHHHISHSASQSVPNNVIHPIPFPLSLASTHPVERERHIDHQQPPPPAATIHHHHHHEAPTEPAPRTAHTNSHNNLRPEDITRGKRSPPHSLHSSFNEGSEMEQTAEDSTAPVATDHHDRDKKSRWRLSRSRKEDFAGSPVMGTYYPNIGSNNHAEISTTSIGSALNKPRKSFTGDSTERLSMSGDRSWTNDSIRESRDDPKGPIGWIKSKYREAKESHEQRRAKSPPPPEIHGFGPSLFPPRGKSLDIKRDLGDDEKRSIREVPREPLDESPHPVAPSSYESQKPEPHPLAPKADVSEAMPSGETKAVEEAPEASVPVKDASETTSDEVTPPDTQTTESPPVAPIPTEIQPRDEPLPPVVEVKTEESIKD